MKNQIKYLQNLFYDILSDYGRVFLVVKYSGRTIIGNRGFTDKEKEKGIILVFNNKNHRSLQWTEDGSIVATLAFGANNKMEKCFLHCDDVVALYSPDAELKFERWDLWDMEDSFKESKTLKNENSPDSKIVSLDKFRK
jgi:hypothetical protein